MKERIRIAAIIVKNHKLLLVKGSDNYKEYWTPGGKREDEESDVDALKRELDEEIHVKGDIEVGKEIQSYVWMTRDEFDKEKYPLLITTRQNIIPDIIKAGYF